jgi:hypothetical protein
MITLISSIACLNHIMWFFSTRLHFVPEGLVAVGPGSNASPVTSGAQYAPDNCDNQQSAVPSHTTHDACKNDEEMHYQILVSAVVFDEMGNFGHFCDFMC